jgi:sulfur-carrier protein adenylyltransferase/sulfurtransferase
MVAYVDQIEPNDAGKFLDEVRIGSRTLVDVRQDFEYAEGHLPGAKHIPLPELQERMAELDRGLPLLLYCRSGARSTAAGNMLAGQGFRHIMSLKGGIMAWQGAQAQGAADLGFDSLHEVKDSALLLERAWGMELALEDFYTGLAARAADSELVELFTRFAAFETRHRGVLSEIWSRLADVSGAADVDAFEASARASMVRGRLEGGVGAEGYLGHMSDPSDPAEAQELAMSIEAQAMDLYLRRAAKATDPDLKRTLNLLAEEERAHLKVLAAFAERRGRF